MLPPHFRAKQSSGKSYLFVKNRANSENTTGPRGGVYCKHEMYVSNDCIFFVRDQDE